MHKRSHNFVKTLLALAILLLLANPIYAEDDLEGTPEYSPGVTIFKAIVTPGQSYANVYGLKDNSDSTYYGLVEITEGVIPGTVYGCRAISGDALTKASCNTVNIKSGTVGTVFGGYAYGGSNSASVHQNTVNIDGGTVSMYIYGGNADGSTISVTGNSVNIKNAYIVKTVYGGCAFNTASWLSMLRNNVVIENSILNGSVYGGYASGNATASNSNTVTIKGDSIINGDVFGGYAQSTNSDAKSNTIYIEGGTLKKFVFGGAGKNATGNTIVIKGGNLESAQLYGYKDADKSHNNNTLEVWVPGIKIKSAQNFENYYFIVPSGVANTDTFMLSTTTPISLSAANVGVALQNGTVLTEGDVVKLINKVEGTPTWVDLVGKDLKGGTLFTACEFTLSVDSDKELLATFKSTYEDPGLLGGIPGGGGATVLETAQSLVAGRSASTALLSEGGDLALAKAMSDAEQAYENASSKGNSVAAFVTLGGGKSSYSTKPAIRMLSGSTVAGISFKDAGVFFETGYGDFSTFTSLETISVFGDGNAQYYGGGLMLHLDPVKGLNLKAIARMGGVTNSWSTDDLDEDVSFETGSMYMGSALEAGYEMQSGSFAYGVFANGSWTHLNGTNANVNGEKVQYEGTDFFKTRLGATARYGKGIVNASLEAAWEHQFNTTSNASVNGLGFDVSSLSGNTGVLELGVTLKPQNAPWQFDISATGSIGSRRAIDGCTYFTISF